MHVFLPEMAAIMEHILTQLAFDSHVACYGPRDWHRPINVCPAAERCIAITRKRGIEFCVDQAWRERIGEVVPGVFNYHGVEPPEELVPGITAAVAEYHAAMRGEAPPMDRVSVDIEALGLLHSGEHWPDSIRAHQAVIDAITVGEPSYLDERLDDGAAAQAAVDALLEQASQDVAVAVHEAPAQFSRISGGSRTRGKADATP